MDNNKGEVETGEDGWEGWEGVGGKGRKLYLNNNKKMFKKKH